MKRSRQQTNCGAFTLLELLTVISIIAILIGIMATGVRQATKIAKNLRQKVELRAMDVGLELFAKDFDGYPESKTLPNATTASAVCGTQHLAEALVGRDSRGFDPTTGWYPPNDQTYRPSLDAAALNSLYNDTDTASMNRRKQPYVEFKYSGIYTIDQLWQGSIGSSTIYTSASATNRGRSPVITDTFGRNEITVGGTTVKVGMPVLYFKADSTKRFHVDDTNVWKRNPTTTDYSKWIYNFDDNLPVVQLPVLSDPSLSSKIFADTDNDAVSDNQAEVFYRMITQTADKSRNYYKPFNTEKFILISAGWDGIYGTKDDITNFNY